MSVTCDEERAAADGGSEEVVVVGIWAANRDGERSLAVWYGICYSEGQRMLVGTVTDAPQDLGG